MLVEGQLRRTEVTGEHKLDNFGVLADGRCDPFGQQKVMHPNDAYAFVDLAEQIGKQAIARRKCKGDMEVLIDKHEIRSGIGLRRRAHGLPRGQKRFKNLAVVDDGRQRWAPKGLELEASSDLIEMTHRGGVWHSGLKAPVSSRFHERFRCQPLQGLSYRSSGDSNRCCQSGLTQAAVQLIVAAQ